MNLANNYDGQHTAGFLDGDIQGLYIAEEKWEQFMSNVTVNISFQDGLLDAIDAEAKRESRSRSELIREAARSYVKRQTRWDQVFALGNRLVIQHGLTESDVTTEIRNVRRKSRTKK